MAAENDLKLATPMPGKKLQVICAGLPRTGTNSFCAAVSILFGGPSYHVGVQTCLSGQDESPVKNWIRIMELWPAKSETEKQELIAGLRSELDGFVCVADPPASLLVPELLEAFPDATVIVSTRDKTKWVASMEKIQTLVLPYWATRTLYFWVPSLRLLPILWRKLGALFRARHGVVMNSRENIYATWDAHERWLEETVPKGKLAFVDVKDGWEPLCKALRVPVPEGVPYPRLNDGANIEALFKGFAVEGLRRWGMALSAVVVAGGMGWWFLL